MPSGLPARVVVVCAILAMAPAVHAQRRPVAVIDLSADPAAEALANELYAILVNHLDLQPVNPTFIRPLKGPFRDEDGAPLAAARQAKRETEEFLAELDYRSAELAAERGTQALHDVRPSPEVLGLYAELAFDIGVAALRQRRPNDAALAFGLAHRLDSARRPDPTRYEPEIVEAFQLAASRTPVLATLEVKGTGTVWIDGVDRGPAPGTFDVSDGLHVVQLSGSARETRGAQVRVPQSTTVAIADAPASDERKVERARGELAAADDATARAGAMKKLAKLLGVGDAVLIETAPDAKLLVQTWRDRAPGFSPHVTYEPGTDPGTLLVPLAPPREPEPPREVIPLPPPPVETPIYRKRWFQGAVATGIFAVAATIFMVASQDRMISVFDDVQEAGE